MSINHSSSYVPSVSPPVATFTSPCPTQSSQRHDRPSGMSNPQLHTQLLQHRSLPAGSMTLATHCSLLTLFQVSQLPRSSIRSEERMRLKCEQTAPACQTKDLKIRPHLRPHSSGTRHLLAPKGARGRGELAGAVGLSTTQPGMSHEVLQYHHFPVGRALSYISSKTHSARIMRKRM